MALSDCEVNVVGADRRDAPLYKIGCTSAIKASFIAFGLHYPSQTANFFEGRISAICAYYGLHYLSAFSVQKNEHGTRRTHGILFHSNSLILDNDFIARMCLCTDIFSNA